MHNVSYTSKSRQVCYWLPSYALQCIDVTLKMVSLEALLVFLFLGKDVIVELQVLKLEIIIVNLVLTRAQV